METLIRQGVGEAGCYADAASSISVTNGETLECFQKARTQRNLCLGNNILEYKWNMGLDPKYNGYWYNFMALYLLSRL